MNLSRDIPAELKKFWKLFERLAYRHQYSTVFEDYLTMCLFNFSDDNPDFKADRDKRMKEYNKEEHQLFNELFFEMFQVYHEQIITKGLAWYDFYGDLYQTISSTQKASALGQFFTPVAVVDMMVRMQNIQQGMTVNDPCCGSGRMLLAAHVHSSGGCFVYGQDADLICCKMTVLNMFFHGCNGEVVWQNSLDLNDYRRGWRISPIGYGMPCIFNMPKEESNIWSVNQNMINEFRKPKTVPEKIEIIEKFPDTLFPMNDEEFQALEKATKVKIKRTTKTEMIEQESLFTLEEV